MLNDGRYTVVYQTGDYRTVQVKTVTKEDSGLKGKTVFSIKEGTKFNGIGFLQEDNKVRFWKRFLATSTNERPVRIQKAVDRIVADPEAAGLAYAMKENRCCRCGKALTVPASVHKGMGPECARKRWNREDQKKVYRALALGRVQEQDRPAVTPDGWMDSTAGNPDEEWIKQKNLFAEQERKQEEKAFMGGL